MTIEFLHFVVFINLLKLNFAVNIAGLDVFTTPISVLQEPISW